MNQKPGMFVSVQDMVRSVFSMLLLLLVVILFFYALPILVIIFFARLFLL